MATDHVTYVDPNGTGDYVSAASWEADLGDTTGNLPSDDLIAVATCRCTGGTADTTAFTMDGWTVDATRYIKIWTDPAESYRHNGTYQTGNKYRLEISRALAVSILENYVRILGIQFQISCDVTWTTAKGILIDINGGNLQIGNNIFKAIFASGNSNEQYAISEAYEGGTETFVNVFNNIFYDWVATGAKTIISYEAGGTQYKNKYYNNTFYNCTSGISGVSADVLINNIFCSCGTNVSGTVGAGTDYNATDDAAIGYTVTGSGNIHDRVSQTFTFVDADNDDFHLASNDAGAKGYGLNLYNDASFPFQTDIDGDDRGGAAAAWDIGADESVAAGGSSIVPLLLYLYRARRQ